MREGDKAPDFILPNTENKEIKFSEILGNNKVLLLFFSSPLSSICTKELCKVRDNIKLYKALNTKVLGVCVDSYFKLRKFKKANNLQFSLLSDFNENVSREYGVLNNKYYGRRAAFVINNNLIVEYAELLEDSKTLPDFQAIHRALGKRRG